MFTNLAILGAPHCGQYWQMNICEQPLEIVLQLPIQSFGNILIPRKHPPNSGFNPNRWAHPVEKCGKWAPEWAPILPIFHPPSAEKSLSTAASNSSRDDVPWSHPWWTPADRRETSSMETWELRTIIQKSPPRTKEIGLKGWFGGELRCFYLETQG